MKRMKKFSAIMLVFAMILSLVACGVSTDEQYSHGKQLSVQKVSKEVVTDKITAETTADETATEDTKQEVTDRKGTAEISDTVVNTEYDADDGEENIANTVVGNRRAPKGEYNKGIVLVKAKESFNNNDLGDLAYTSAEALYGGSKWYAVKLTDMTKTEEAVIYLSNLDTFEKVDYDYVMGVTAKETENPDYDKQTNLGLSNIPYGWTQNGKAPGGSSDVVVAVIDTGVDYTHLDLRNNIWINTAEIPDNGLDDDGNGYVDDVYGWDCVGNDKDPMDDNGHGTHVAGIIAAENNKIGGIGVAYNCKIMVLKAGNSSGYFNNSDIAEAIQYAYMNGASVINMSFGGSFISIAVEEALENAYNSCVLVAAAGNDSACNDLSCKKCENVGVSYPAALPYVIGVMSTDKNGSRVSSFSNYDHNPYDSIEYEVYAVGEGVGSTWPSNKYACLNGTSMAAPTVSGIAALLRSYYTDREVYSTKFIQSQIVNTGTVNPYNALLKETDDAHSVADAHEAMTKLPKPAVNLYGYTIDDSTSISPTNNGNGVIDAGETVRLYISLHNRGGVASNVNVSIDTYRSEIGNEALTDPYFTFVNPTMQLSDIGTYSVRESGDKYFEIVVSADCPNDYLVNFNIRYTYTNGMDDKDNTVYTDDGKQKARFNVSSGYHLPSVISEDTTFTNNRLYIVGEDVMIPAGVTVTFEEGCEIQFYDDREYYNSPIIKVYGTLNLNGSKDNMIEMYPNERHITFGYGIQNYGYMEVEYAKIINCSMIDETKESERVVSHSFITNQCDKYNYIKSYKNGRVREAYTSGFSSNGGLGYHNAYYYQNYIKLTAYAWGINAHNLNGNIITLGNNSNDLEMNTLINNTIINIDCDELYASDIIVGYKNEGMVSNNQFYAQNIRALPKLVNFNSLKYYDIQIENNEYSPLYQQYASQVIDGYYDASGNPTVDVYGSCSDIAELWPYVVSVEMFDKDGNAITTVGREEIKVRVTFNRPMDTTKDTYLTFGTIEPYADYRINGEYVSDTVWEGTYTLKAQIENGQNFLKVNNACAAEDPTKTVFGEYHLHEFTIDTTAAMAMNLQAFPKENGIELNFAQDDYDTLLGYNIYRAESKDGNYVKLNPAIILPDENSFLDENAEPGKTYWYTYTVVLTDFSESNPAGKVTATAMDTMSPSLYHTPVNQGYAENNLVISCTASDNMAIASVMLYYRTVGSDTWKSLAMSKVNDKYSATVFGSELTLDGIEYYIVASDGLNTVSKGTADAPYTVVIKDASSISRIGDVDGSGSVTTKDALMLMQCLNGDLILSDDEFKRADLNGNGTLSSAEALRILQYVNGKVTTLEM